MNQLSWLIYLADVAGSAKVAASGVVATSVVVAVASRLTVSFNQDMSRIWKEGQRFDQYIARAEAAGKVPRKALTVAAIAMAALVASPSKETVYAIAASEMGEQLLKTPTFNKATAALDAWLDRQIAKPVGVAQ